MVLFSNNSVWPSLGGWSLSDPFSELARSNINRKKFADNCAKLVEEYGFDGIDIGASFLRINTIVLSSFRTQLKYTSLSFLP